MRTQIPGIRALLVLAFDGRDDAAQAGGDAVLDAIDLIDVQVVLFGDGCGRVAVDGDTFEDFEESDS